MSKLVGEFWWLFAMFCEWTFVTVTHKKSRKSPKLTNLFWRVPLGKGIKLLMYTHVAIPQTFLLHKAKVWLHIVFTACVTKQVSKVCRVWVARYTPFWPLPVWCWTVYYVASVPVWDSYSQTCKPSMTLILNHVSISTTQRVWYTGSSIIYTHVPNNY